MTTAQPGAPAAVTFHGVSPVLRVRGLGDSRAYYADVLGFDVDWEHPSIVCVSRGNCSLFLTDSDQGNPGAWAWIGVSDVDALHGELAAHGALILNPPRNFFWGREMQVGDPDGNVLRICSDARPGEPIGPWRDMYGHFWHAQPDGSWVREDGQG